MATTTRTTATERDLVRMPRDGRKYELVDGQVRVSPGGARHGRVCVNLVVRLEAAVRAGGRLGHVFDSSTAFRLPAGDVRSPDVSFVAAGRFPDGEELPKGFPDLAPDLAVEVLSPEDRPRDVLDKVGEYLEAGVRLVAVVDPERRRANLYRSLTEVLTLGADDVVDLSAIVPGLVFTLREVLE
jgi:Uma2 family endonuclease